MKVSVARDFEIIVFQPFLDCLRFYFSAKIASSFRWKNLPMLLIEFALPLLLSRTECHCHVLNDGRSELLAITNDRCYCTGRPSDLGCRFMSEQKLGFILLLRLNDKIIVTKHDEKWENYSLLSSPTSMVMLRNAVSTSKRQAFILCSLSDRQTT